MKPTYISQITECINATVDRRGPVFLYGENIDTGSRIAGLARGLKVAPERGAVRNVGNCELTHAGVGFGIMLDGGNAALFMKQLDFLLLGLDQVVNTYSFIRSCGRSFGRGSFTVYPIVCDQGYQGPQSSLNSAADIASLANVPVYCLNGTEDATHVIESSFVAPGFRIICTSQKSFGMPALDASLVARSMDNAVFQYFKGSDVTIACFNFMLRDGMQIASALGETGISADVFHINFVPGLELDLLANSCRRTGCLVVLDDSKTVTKFGDMLFTELAGRGISARLLMLSRRGVADSDYGVCDDQMRLDFAQIESFVKAV